jgi:hypothetical protein
MKLRHRLSSRAATIVLVAALGATAPFLTNTAHSAPKRELEIWPGRRVVLVLPIGVAPTWNSDPALGRAIVPLAQPQLQKALYNTGKFSTTLPYRFDPVLRRGLTEKRIAENDLTALLSSPSLITSRPVVDKLMFDQPVMTADVQLQEVRVGGTPKAPTVQLQVSGSLYEQGNPKPVKSITVTSEPVRGRTPSERLAAAADLAFMEIAREFVEPPPAFELPVPVAPAPTTKPTRPGSAPVTPARTPTTPAMGAVPPAVPDIPMSPPNSLSPAPGVPFVPQLPPAQPPLGIAAGQEPTVGG